jgi:hypothetical protein
MREAQGWSGRTSPRIGLWSTQRAHTSFPRVLHMGSHPMRRRRPGVSSALLLSRITPVRGRCQLGGQAE